MASLNARLWNLKVYPYEVIEHIDVVNRMGYHMEYLSLKSTIIRRTPLLAPIVNACAPIDIIRFGS